MRTLPLALGAVLLPTVAATCATRERPIPGPVAVVRGAPGLSDSAAAREEPVASASAVPSTGQPAPSESSHVAVHAWPEGGKRIPLQIAGGNAEAWAPNIPPNQGPAPVSVYYHGLSARAVWECPVAWGAMDHGWVVCADGNVPYASGFAWSVPGSKARADAALAALTVMHKDLVSEQRGLLIGYSLGAIAAWHHLETSSESWAGLVFLNTTHGVKPSVVKEKGLERVAMVAGQSDGSALAMARTAENLKRQGIDARFFRLEKTGHYFDDETWKRMVVPLRWAFGGEE
jgi:hypothetical protein